MTEPLIIDRDKALISVWHPKSRQYMTFTFNAIEDLAVIIKQEDDIEGVIYEPLSL